MEHEVTIEGTRAILLHKYTVATISEPKARITTRDSNNYSDEWKKSTYQNSKGEVVIPATNIMACLFDGSKGMKIGRKAATRHIYTSLMVTPFEANVMYDSKVITLNDIETNDWLHMCGAVVSGRRIDRVRTCIPAGWKVKFLLQTLNNDLNTEDIRSVLDNAGRAAGLGDWRPSSPKKPGPYGTFKVIAFE